MSGIAILRSEITSIDKTGFWLLVGDKEYYIAFADYPVFNKATVARLYDFTESPEGQFHWNELDADIEEDALENPEKFPLIYQ